MRSIPLMLVVAVVAAATAHAQTAEEPALPSIPGLEEAQPPRPLPGSAEVGRNPLNAAHLDTLMLVEGLLARGFGIAAGFERSLGRILAFEAEGGYLGSANPDPLEGWHLSLASLSGGIRLSLLQTAVNGPSLGLSAGAALAWFLWSDQLLFYVWPQARIDLAMKLSLGTGARGFFVEPRVGYKVAIKGAETEGLPIPRYGGLTAGIRLGFSF